MRRLAIPLFLLAHVLSWAATRPLGALTVDLGATERQDVPVVHTCTLADLGGPFGKGSLQLQAQGAEPIPAQWDPLDDHEPDTGTGALLFILPGRTSGKRTFTLVHTDRAAQTPLAVEDRDSRRLVFTANGKPILRYNYGVVRCETVPAKYKTKVRLFDRPCYIHPVWTPSGVVVTDDFPDDHPHQRGIFFAWVKAKCGAFQADFWNLGKNTGRTTLDKVTHAAAGPVVATLASHNTLRAPEEPVIRETLIVRIWATGDGPRLFDVLVRHEPIDEDVVLEKNFYGGIAYRGAREWLDGKKLQMLTSEGKDRKSGNLQHSRWVDTFGTVGGKKAGVVVFDHPSNLRHPQPNRLHPTVPYVGYILPQKAPHTIKAGEALKLRYRFLVYDGDPDRARNDRIASDMAHPPLVEWRRAQ
ncbi:PmoA family protein [bacterium]|nr:PmoA family protein [bacterium]